MKLQIPKIGGKFKLGNKGLFPGNKGLIVVVKKVVIKKNEIQLHLIGGNVKYITSMKYEAISGGEPIDTVSLDIPIELNQRYLDNKFRKKKVKSVIVKKKGVYLSSGNRKSSHIDRCTFNVNSNFIELWENSVESRLKKITKYLLNGTT